MKTLIVYYSKSGENWFDGKKQYLEKGNNEILAQYVKELTNGDLFRLEMVHPYSNNYDTCCDQTLIDQKNNARPPLLHLPRSIEEYSIIYLIYPIYWSNAPMPVFTFLNSYDFSNKIIYPLCSHEGSSFGSSLSFIRKEVPSATVIDPLPIPGSLVYHAYNRVKNWIENHKK